VARWKSRANSAEENLKAALEDKKKDEGDKKESDEVAKTLKAEAEDKHQRITKLDGDLNNEKMESALSFYNGFNRAKSQADLLCRDVDFS